MGTSKGYIAPSTTDWTNVKRSITKYINSPTDKEKESIVNNYAKAFRNSTSTNNQVVQTFNGFLSFVGSSKANGLEQALHDIECEHLLSLDSKQALDELLLYYTNSGDTIDNQLALDALAETLSVLGIEEIEEILEIDVNEFLKELICQFAQIKFAQLFDKQIRNKCHNNEKADRVIDDLQNYIYYVLKMKLTDDILIRVNPYKISNETIITEIINEASKIMEEYYGE